MDDKQRLKHLYANPDPGHWDWDEENWRWELALRDGLEGFNCGYCYIQPVMEVEHFNLVGSHCCHGEYPDSDQQEWFIGFVLDDALYENGIEQIEYVGTMAGAKDYLDQMIQITPPFPEFPEISPEFLAKINPELPSD